MGTRPLCRLQGQAHDEDLMNILSDGPPWLIGNKMTAPLIVHLLHPPVWNGGNGVGSHKSRQELQRGSRNQPNVDVPELADDSQDNFRGRLVVAADGWLEV